MQSTKNTFYRTLRDRLAALNPQRTILLDGAERPAVVVAENESMTAAEPLPNSFYVAWGAVRPAAGTQSSRPLFALDCTISYRTARSDDGAGLDRGRTLAALDSELLQICAPPEMPKLDYTQTPATELGTRIFWTRPQLGAIESVGRELRRTATLTIFFYPESDC